MGTDLRPPFPYPSSQVRRWINQRPIGASEHPTAAELVFLPHRVAQTFLTTFFLPLFSGWRSVPRGLLWLCSWTCTNTLHPPIATISPLTGVARPNDLKFWRHLQTSLHPLFMSSLLISISTTPRLSRCWARRVVAQSSLLSVSVSWWPSGSAQDGCKARPSAPHSFPP